MSTIFLHIGTEKTGSKTIQSFLQDNSDLFISQNTYIPNFLGWANRKITCLGFNYDTNDDFFISDIVLERDDIVKKIDEYRKEFSEKASVFNGNDWIVSSEFMHSRLQSLDELINFKNILSEYFDNIKIVLYIRNQLDSAISLWSTAVQSGMPWDRLQSPHDMSFTFDHKNTIEKWSHVFGDNIVVRIFDRDDFVGGDLLKDFCCATSIEWNDSFKIPESKNESMSYIAIQILAGINKKIPSVVDGVINEFREDIASFVRDYFISYPRYVASIEERFQYKNYYEASNEWVRMNFFNNKKTLFQEFPIVETEDGLCSDYSINLYADFVAEILERMRFK